jgi:carbon monoxide dehydrogenase subunit G
MYNILKLLAILFLLTLIFLVIIGLTAKPESSVNCTEIIRSPATVVWQILTDPDKMPQWYGGIEKVELEKRQSIEKNVDLRLFDPKLGNGIYYRVRIEDFVLEKQISLIRIGSGSNKLLQDYKQDFQLKSLLDGTTEISYKISYRSATFLTRIFNKLYLRKELQNQGIERLHKLKQVIEKV